MDTPRCTRLDRLTRYDIELLIRFDRHPHDIKRHDSRRDLFKDREGEVYICQKDGSGEPDPADLNLRDIREQLRRGGQKPRWREDRRRRTRRGD